jgi:hypothetical protein
MSNYEFHNGLRNPGLYSLISHKSAAADEKRTLVGNDTTSGSIQPEPDGLFLTESTKSKQKL